MDNDGGIWTNLILLRIRRLGFESLRARSCFPRQARWSFLVMLVLVVIWPHFGRIIIRGRIIETVGVAVHLAGVTDNRHGQRWTPPDADGRSFPGQTCRSAGSACGDLASGRRGRLFCRTWPYCPTNLGPARFAMSFRPCQGS